MTVYIAYNAYVQSLSFCEVCPPLALLLIIDKETRIEDKEPVFEGRVHLALLEQDSFLDRLKEIKSKTSTSSSSHG